MRSIVMNPEDLTLGDMELFEEATGQDLFETLKAVPDVDPETGMPIPDPANPGRPLMTVKVNTKALLGLIYVVLKKDQPDITIEEVKKLKISDFDFQLEVPKENPTAGENPN